MNLLTEFNSTHCIIQEENFFRVTTLNYAWHAVILANHERDFARTMKISHPLFFFMPGLSQNHSLIFQSKLEAAVFSGEEKILNLLPSSNLPTRHRREEEKQTNE